MNRMQNTYVFTGAGLLLGLFLFKQVKRKSKSPPMLPPEGPDLKDFGNAASNGLLTKNQVGWAKQFGSIFCVRSPLPAVMPHIVIVGDVNVAKQLLLQEASKRNFTSRSPSIAWATRQGEGRSLTSMSSTDDEWKWRKTALLKEFHRKRMEESDRGLLLEIVKTSKELCRRLSEAATSEQPVEVDYITSHVVIDVILYFLFGRRINFDTQVFRSSAQTMLETVFQCSVNPLYFVMRYFPFTRCYEMDRKCENAWNDIDSVTRHELDEILNELDTSKATVTTDNQRNPGAAIVSLLTKESRFLGGGMDSLIADLRVFVLAGFETTAHALSFAFGLLALHPEVGEKIAKEGRAVWDKLKSEDAVKVQQALDEAPTARLLFLEAIRLYPLVPTLPGICLENVTVRSSKGEKYDIPKGTQILFANMVLNRQQGGESLNTSLWEAPPVQQPFINNFNTGAHVCPGKSLSLLEAHIFLLMAATQFEFVLPLENHKNPPSLDFECRALLEPKAGMPLLIRERR